MASLLSMPDINTTPLIAKLSSSPITWSLFIVRYPWQFKNSKRLVVLAPSAVYTQGLSVSSPTNLANRAERIEPENDSISALNERIRRDFAKREVSRTAMDSEEADKYIRLVKEQQQRGLQKLKGDRESKEGVFSYQVDPYTLRSGDYVVHKKVGIGRFVGIKFDVPKNSTEPIEYVFIEYADGMAKLPVKHASRMLYRYSL